MLGWQAKPHDRNEDGAVAGQLELHKATSASSAAKEARVNVCVEVTEELMEAVFARETAVVGQATQRAKHA